jgi:hypothetical protein
LRRREGLLRASYFTKETLRGFGGWYPQADEGRAQARSGSIMASRSQRHGRANAPRGRRAPPCMWRGAGMELSDDLYARLPAQGWRGRVKGGASSLKVLHLDIDTVRGRIRHSLNTSDDAKAIERAKAIVAKALGEGRIQQNSLATLTYATPQSAKPVCCKIQTTQKDRKRRLQNPKT